jgi:hypothetical protein
MEKIKAEHQVDEKYLFALTCRREDLQAIAI